MGKEAGSVDIELEDSAHIHKTEDSHALHLVEMSAFVCEKAEVRVALVLVRSS
jgi:hypothetical protein